MSATHPKFMMRYVVFLLLVIMYHQSLSQIDLNKGLMACYSFNGNANDDSGNGHDGIVKNAQLTIDRCGKVNSAYMFSVNTEIDLKNPVGLATSQYSYSFWANSSRNPQSGEVLILLSIGSGGGDQNVSNSNNTGTNGACIGWAGWGYGTNVPFDQDCYTQGYLPTIGKWDYLTFTRDNNTKKFFVNGRLVASFSSRGVDAFYGNGIISAVLGTRQGGSVSNHFQGAIDDVRIYNRVLTDGEIKALYTQNCQTVSINNQPVSCPDNKTMFTAKGVSNTLNPVYQWKVDGVNIGNPTKDSTFSQTFPVKGIDYSVKIDVEVSYSIGCVNTHQVNDSKVVTVKSCTTIPTTISTSEKIYIPTAFTPNNDGVNDTFKIIGLDKNDEATIYNRWGEVIFYSKGYAIAWDGKYNGLDVISGTYTYIVTLGNGNLLKGSISVLR